MKSLRMVIVSVCVAAMLGLTSCAEKKTRKVTVEGPEKKTEIKVETTTKEKDKK